MTTVILYTLKVDENMYKYDKKYNYESIIIVVHYY